MEPPPRPELQGSGRAAGRWRRQAGSVALSSSWGSSSRAALSPGAPACPEQRCMGAGEAGGHGLCLAALLCRDCQASLHRAGAEPAALWFELLLGSGCLGRWHSQGGHCALLQDLSHPCGSSGSLSPSVCELPHCLVRFPGPLLREQPRVVCAAAGNTGRGRISAGGVRKISSNFLQTGSSLKLFYL